VAESSNCACRGPDTPAQLSASEIHETIREAAPSQGNADAVHIDTANKLWTANPAGNALAAIVAMTLARQLSRENAGASSRQFRPWPGWMNEECGDSELTRSQT